MAEELEEPSSEISKEITQMNTFSFQSWVFRLYFMCSPGIIQRNLCTHCNGLLSRTPQALESRVRNLLS